MVKWDEAQMRVGHNQIHIPPQPLFFLGGPQPPNIKGGMMGCLGGLTPISLDGVDSGIYWVGSTEGNIDIIIGPPNEVARLKALDPLPSSKTSVFFMDPLPYLRKTRK